MKTARLRPVDPGDLLSIDIFSHIELEERKALASKMQYRRYKKAALLFSEGDSGDELFAVLSGSIRISIKTRDGEEVELSQVKSGGFFGDMAIIEQAPRSASAWAAEASECIVLKSADFDALMIEAPEAATAMLDSMVRIAAGRLVTTGAFVTRMVQWGDDARKRAVADPATGLFNRRYLDDNLENLIMQAKNANTALCFAMFDLDHFGELNTTYGAAFCDSIILRLAEVFRSCFGEEDILVRYGGDEFCFIIRAGIRTAYARCLSVCESIRKLTWLDHPDVSISCSIGISLLGPEQNSAKLLLEAADTALYRAKESGRDRVSVFIKKEKIKQDIYSIARKNRIGRMIIRALVERESFLIIGHKDPDEDCISSMVAFALLASKFNKRAVIALGPNIPDSFQYLLKICRYNAIELCQNCKVPTCSTLVLVDTPKPDMIDQAERYEVFRADPSVLKIEIDHHLEADSRYFTDPQQSLVYQASSACEIIAWLTLKIQKDEALIQEQHIEELLSRNLVLAILSGILGDTQMGRYIKTRREKLFYKRFTNLFERILAEKTRVGSGNFSSKEQIFTTIATLSSNEEACYRDFMEDLKTVQRIHSVVLGKARSEELLEKYGNETCVSVSKSIANQLAEESGYLGLSGYFDCNPEEPQVQFRLRRSSLFTGIDLRQLLKKMNITNGGGHPGAVGFRLPEHEISDISKTEKEIFDTVSSMLEATSLH